MSKKIDPQDPHYLYYIKMGRKIAYYRSLCGYTQEQVSGMVDRNPNYISHVERAAKAQPISMELLFKLADVFKIPPHKLLEFDE